MADCADLTYAVLKMDQLMAVIVLDNEGAGGIRVDRRKILTEVRVERTGDAGIEAEVFLFGFISWQDLNVLPR